MIKKIVFVVLVLISGQLFSQENTPSPYSYYGVGLQKFKGTNNLVSMGGLTVYSDSIHLNVLNPASYSNQMLTSIQVGGTGSFYKLSNSSVTEKAKKTTFDYLVIGLPYNKNLGFSIGLVPETAVGYRFNSTSQGTEGTITKTYTGSGGLNKVYIGGGYKLKNGLSFGMDFQYLFGSIESRIVLSEIGVLYGSREINTTAVSGVRVNLAANYFRKLNSKLNLTSSITFLPETKVKSENNRQTSPVAVSANGNVTNVENPIEINSNTRLNLPSKTNLGVGLGNRKWFVGMDYTIIGKTTELNRLEVNNNVTYETGSKIAVGGFYLPQYDSYNNYLKRITYRAGFRFEKTGIIVNNQSINERAVNLGLAFPITGSFSTLSIGTEWGSRGTTSNGLIKENYFSLNVGLIFNDRWFKKSLYN